jgi:hypothetical protein
MSPLDPPPALQRVGFSHLFALEVAVDALQAIGSPGAERRVGRSLRAASKETA